MGLGVNDSRPQFLQLLADPSIAVMVVDHHDRATRSVLPHISTQCWNNKGRRIAVIDRAEKGRDDLVADLVAIVYCSCVRLDGERRAKSHHGDHRGSADGLGMGWWRKSGNRRWARMRLVEQHRIDRHDPRWAAIDAAAFASKNLYNAALYRTRQAYITEHRISPMRSSVRDMQTTRVSRAAQPRWRSGC